MNLYILFTTEQELGCVWHFRRQSVGPDRSAAGRYPSAPRFSADVDGSEGRGSGGQVEVDVSALICQAFSHHLLRCQRREIVSSGVNLLLSDRITFRRNRSSGWRGRAATHAAAFSHRRL
ncbi:hypothetical protein CHARACLAT_011314 [Characodon lateralis]|uniref:Uncharacterized protein n=1 Tax=Characodon lateralis TaxID=208331 RepID=A0ABU7DFM6_9TELE|nr:hypothetical protein [Characodon lateralis]